MLWSENYKPRNFEEIISHSEIVTILDSFTIKNVPNIIIHGPNGSNKRTILFAFLQKLYGYTPVFKKITQELQITSSTVEISYLQSEEIILINPSIYKYKDRIVVQHIIKTFAETKQISSFFDKRTYKIKTIIIEQAENLTRDAQAALRITMEEYVDHFRIFMISSEISQMIESIKSRCLFLQCRKFFDSEIVQILSKIGIRSDYSCNKKTLIDIAKNAQGDCKRAIELFELYSILSKNEDSVKIKKMDLGTFSLSWEQTISSIVSLIKHPLVENMEKIRNMLYEVLMTNVDSKLLFLRLHQYCMKEINDEKLLELALKFFERLKMGSKPLFHIEAYVAAIMNLIHKKLINC
ncbi:RFC5 [Ecytonucleospora hepatopenaei]|uniref:RFC5 n=1 Tax=Ecytonucleospora hepatopenaei TaxID=646526 RepID=A0A1W0E5S8_9MICR|nr:RFC5 [Ecytonucleospora hepatopenaei]